MSELCDLPDVDIEEDEGKDDRALAYLRYKIEDARARCPIGAAWSFPFDMVRSNHSRGRFYMVASTMATTQVWRLRSGGSSDRKGREIPAPGQYVASAGVGLHALGPKELISLMAEIDAEEIMTG